MSSSLEIVSMLESRLSAFIESVTGLHPSKPIHIPMRDLQSRESFSKLVTMFLTREIILRDHLATLDHFNHCNLCRQMMDNSQSEYRARQFVDETIEQMAEVRLLRGN